MANYKKYVKVAKKKNPKERTNLSELINNIYNHFFWPLQIKSIFEI